MLALARHYNVFDMVAAVVAALTVKVWRLLRTSPR
jgi:hypothetical protein